MAHFYRIVILCLCLISQSSFALVNCVQVKLQSPVNGAASAWMDKGAACSWYASEYNGSIKTYSISATLNSSGGGCDVKRSDGAASGVNWYDVRSGMYCEPPPPVADAKVVCDALNFLKAPLFVNGSPGLSTCYAGVLVTGSGSAGAGGKSEVYGPFACASPPGGGNCTVPAAPAPKPCSVGTFSGVVNGVSVCVPPQSSVAAGPSRTASAPSGSSTAPAIEGAPAGTTSSGSTTTCSAGACTTTTTYNGSGGASLGTRSDTESQGTYCDKNPKAKICGTPEPVEGSFGGACAGGFVCKGDAVQCAIAQETFVRNCQFFDTMSPDMAEFNAAKAASKTEVLIKSKDVTISSASFDSSNILGGGSCIADKSVTVAGKSVTIPLSQVCAYLVYIGYLNMMAAFLLAGRIVVRG